MTFLYEQLSIPKPHQEEKNGNHLLEQINFLHHQLMETYETTIHGWIHALELHDGESREHAFRVASMTETFARYLGFKDPQIFHIRNGALLHDIGKLGVPGSILKKCGPLAEDEWEIVRKHPIHAYQLLSPISFLKPALEIPLYHHEKWNGGGYPYGLSKEQIPLPARIFTVVDVWDALRSNRPYRNEAWSDKKIIAYLEKQSGEDFDPEIVKAFVKLLNQPNKKKSFVVDTVPRHQYNLQILIVSPHREE